MLKFRNQVTFPLLSTVFLLLFNACGVTADSKSPAVNPARIHSFEECVKAGYPIMRTYPARCAVPGGKTFVEKVADSNWNPPGPQPTLSYGGDFVNHPGDHRGGSQKAFCKDKCGDGECQEIVCMAEGCPCAESRVSCPQDCKG